MADARPHDRRARSAEPVVRLRHLRRGRRHASAHARGRRVDPQGDAGDPDGAPHLRQPHPRPDRRDPRRVRRRRGREHPRPRRRPAVRSGQGRTERVRLRDRPRRARPGVTAASRSASPPIPRSIRGRTTPRATVTTSPPSSASPTSRSPSSSSRSSPTCASSTTSPPAQVDKPVIPGIMPITNIASVARMAQLSGRGDPGLADRAARSRRRRPRRGPSGRRRRRDRAVAPAPRAGRARPALLHTQPVDRDPRDLRQPRPGSLSAARPRVGAPAQGGHA